MWGMRHSSDDDGEKKFLRRRAEWLAKRGRKVGVPVEEEPPQLFDDLKPVWQAWLTLQFGRQIGMVPCGIPWTVFSTYCEDNGIDGEARARVCRLLVRMDAAWLNEKARRESVPDASPGTIG